ncbi:hypothetical protein BGW42_000587 [Actinomortierella wolfii]|nr:hypothetical protein BGW42_000587 [Actinomortierella wolfii]
MTPLMHAVNKNSLQMVELLLEHPKIDVNLKDLESGWTALHRALYRGYLRIALALLAHKNIDPTIEDKDKNTAIDLYLASTPSILPRAPCPGDTLYTWGSNSNFTLGHNDADDRALPEIVKFPHQTSTINFPRASAAKFKIYNVSMEKFHTSVATSESGLAVKIWGYGSGGRLGNDKKMQSRPSPVTGIAGQAVLTSLGRDHTVIVTNKGDVYTFGNNKYGQLGYTVDAPKPGQDPIHLSPKRVIQGIGRLHIIGASASKWHTVVHSETELYTWGFNYGQLGYERKGDIQATPRKVVSIPPGRYITQVTASDNYHTVVNANKPTKVASCDNKFGAMTGWGDVFVWQYPEVDADITLGSLAPTASSILTPSTPGTSNSAHFTPEPRRVWVYGGDQTEAVDFALGQNGAVILLTKSGHVYIGTNRGSSIGRNVKWRRVQHLDRIVQVQASSSGAWAAIRSDVHLKSIVVRPSTLGKDLERAITLNMLYHDNEKSHPEGSRSGEEESEDMDDDDPDIWKMDFSNWMQLTKQWDKLILKHPSEQDVSVRFQVGYPVGYCPPHHHLFDVDVQCGTRVLGAHRIILAARSSILRKALVETPLAESKLGMLVSVHPVLDPSSHNRLYQIRLHGIEFATAALLVQFLYSDRFDPFWDALKLNASDKAYSLKVRQQLYHLALELALPTLQAALQYSSTHRCHRSLSSNLGLILDDPDMFQGLEDVTILLAGGAKIKGHQVILAQRSPAFYAMLAHTDSWTRERQSPRRLAVDVHQTKTRLLELDLKHVDLETMQFVMRFIYMDCGPEMFDLIEKEEMVDLIQVVVNVLQVADELMLYRLKDICEHILGQQVRPKTLVSLLEIADTFSAEALKNVCLDYLCQNLESALDQKWLVGVDSDLLKIIEDTLMNRLDATSPFVRAGGHLPPEHRVAEMRLVLQKRAAFEAAMALNDAEVQLAKSRRARSPTKTPSMSLVQEKPGSESSVVPPVAASSQPVVSDREITSPKEETVAWARVTTSKPMSTLSTSASAVNASSVDRKPNNGMSAPTSEWPGLVDSIESSNGRRGSGRSTSFSASSTHHTDHDGHDSQYQGKAPLVKKTGWDTITPGMEGADRLLNSIVGFSPMAVGPKPSLREILEQEQSQHQQQQQTLLSAGGAHESSKDKAVKLSQKERRRLHQQQTAATLAESAASTSSPRGSATNPWGKVTKSAPTTGSDASATNALGNGKVALSIAGNDKSKEDDGKLNGGTRSLFESETTSYVFDPSPQALIALLEAQARDLLLLSGEQASTSLSMDSLSGRSIRPNDKPLTVTASPTTVSSGGMPKSSTPLSSSSGTVAKEAPWRRDAIPEPLWSISSPKDAIGANVLSPPTRTSSSSAHLQKSTGVASSSSSVSAFALIQNQQLRDRNQLLLARQRKKPLSQIQVEEQAMAQLRAKALSSIRDGSVAGTGEWFTCELGL